MPPKVTEKKGRGPLPVKKLWERTGKYRLDDKEKIEVLERKE